MESIAKTWFYASLASVICFYALEFIIPGFVSNYLPMNLFWALAFLSGFWYAFISKPKQWNKGRAIAVGACVGALFAVLAESALHESFFTSFFAFIVPMLIIGLIYEKS
ncbi:MAG: hypothetical protein ACD_76C00015G0004 [uncultured bacterium]|nr:MAG: hypothetical protein ACD_76C00015G0004 [uncultured bacterium]HBD05059.1 hypothetical protein [Candidatus Uhrbacteria bacterium]